MCVSVSVDRIRTHERNRRRQRLRWEDFLDRPGIEDHLTTVDAIEAQTGLDFLHELPDELEDQIEALRAEGLW